MKKRVNGNAAQAVRDYEALGDKIAAKIAMREVVLHPVHPNPALNHVHLLIGVPTLGIIRVEFMNAMNGMVSPPNWSLVRATPTGYTTADAQNLLVDTALRGNFRALLFIEDDTCPPPQTLIVLDRWLWKMERKKCPPVISGLYHIKGSAEVRHGKKGGIELLGPEPLIYRGSGQRAYRDWTPGDVVYCSGVPTGALLIHRSILEAWSREPDLETYTLPGYPFPLKKMFQNPSHVWVDPQSGQANVSAGTSDLYWSDQTIKRDILKKAGWGELYQKGAIAKQSERGKWPFIADTSLRFMHVDRSTGQQF
jgi:hypothetical protein